MGVLDFLFQGTTPSTSTTTSGTAVPGWLQQYTAGLLSEGAAVASQPYSASQGPQVADTTQDQQNAYSTIRGLQGGYQPAIQQASNLVNSSSNPGAIGQAIGSLGNAQNQINASVAPNASQINPYVSNVINKATNDATRYWNQSMLPSINNQFTSAGQYGSSANQRAAQQGAANITGQIQDTANAQYANAYQNAQQANLAAGQASGALGQTLGGLGYEQGVLGMQGASQLGNLAQLGQTLGIQGAGALDSAGLEQQNQNQQNLNVAQANFNQQQQYPYQQLGWLSQLLNGQSVGIPGGSTSSQVSTQGNNSGTSPLFGAIGSYINQMG